MSVNLRNYYLQSLKIDSLKYRKDIAARNFLKTQSQIFNFNLYGNVLSTTLVIVNETKLFQTNSNIDTLFIKMLKSINLTINDIFVLNYEDIQDAHEQIILKYISLLKPTNILILGNFTRIHTENKKSGEPIKLNESNVILSHSLLNLIDHPHLKKDAYRDLLLLKQLIS